MFWSLVFALVGCSESLPERPRGVLLISIDTLRLDATSLYGSGKQTTPFLEELGSRGVVFEKHVANSNNTLVSHATMLTGLYPEAHGTFDHGDQTRTLAPSAVTLAEHFSGGGYQTAAFTAHPTWLGSSFGLDQGFEELQTGWVDAGENSRRLLTWLDNEEPERFFAFVHFYDAHSELANDPKVLPYEAPPEFLARFAPERPADFTGEAINRSGEKVATSRYLEHYSSPFRELPAGHLEFLQGAYDAGVAKLDADLRELFDALEERGLTEDLLIVITSDHGEEFKEHRRLLHMEYHDEIMRVPLVIVPPSGRLDAYRAAGLRARVPELSRSVDLLPTLLELCDLKSGFSQGQSLAPTVTSGALIPWRDSLFGESILRGRDANSEFKICDIENYFSFYDLDQDPGEQESLVDRKRAWNRVDEERWQAIRERVDAQRTANRTVLARIVAKDGESQAQLSDAERDTLRGLGYFGESGDSEDSDAPDKR